MILLSQEKDEEKRYLILLNKKIQYETIMLSDKERMFVIGSIKVPYFYDDDKGEAYIKLLNKKIVFKTRAKDRRQRHYEDRRHLTTEKCKELLKHEIAQEIGYIPNLEKPASFNEKILWSKLYYKNPLITTCCDKYAVKKYVADLIGEEYVLPVFGVWKNARDIPFDELPECYVLKVNWSSGYNIFIKNGDVQKDKVINQLNDWMRPEMNAYYDTFNWGYKDMKPCIYAEPYIEQLNGQVYDYKFYYSNGEFIYMFIATDRHGEHSLTYTFFDNNLEPLPFTYGGKLNASPIPQMPKQVIKMIELGKVLAKPFPFVRVDFYEIEDCIYVGEMTFYSGGGTLRFEPLEWDYKLGEKINF